MINSSGTKIKLTKVLAQKLYSLSLIIGFLIALGIPSTFYLIESRSLQKTTDLYAEDLADSFRDLGKGDPRIWKYQQPKFDGIISLYNPKKELISIQILDRLKQEIPIYKYDNPDLKNWEKKYFVTSYAPIIFNNRTIGTVKVTNCKKRLFFQTFYLLLFSSLIGLSLAILVYRLPISISVHQEEQIQKLFNEIEYTAFHDPLTGLLNRTAFLNHLSQAIKVNKQDESYLFAVFFLDLDRFKLINDSLGHLIGDRLLIAMAERITQSVRSKDRVARFGGDEFVILLEQISDLNEATKIGQRILSQLQQPFDLEGHKIVVTTSIGIAHNKENFYHKAVDILRDADNALYRAKQLGKNRYELFDQKMHLQALIRLDLENDLRQAVELKQIEAFYQPIINFKKGRIEGFEALARWVHPVKGLISPSDFIGIAEEIGIIVPLSNLLLHKTCLQFAQWRQQYQLDLILSFNISAIQFAQPNFVETINKILQETNFPPQNLLLEVTESTIIKDINLAKSIIQELLEQKIRIAMDDFGTGYSSLSYLYQLPFNKLKIDRSFVQNVETDPDKLAVLRAISILGNDLGINLIAEGIETEKQLKTIQELNITYGQGYLFSQPLNFERTEALIANKNQFVEQFFPPK